MNCKALLTCEKVIIDKQGAHSLINLMLNASIKLQEVTTAGDETARDIQIPKNAFAPTQWWIYTQWEPSLDDIGKRFVQKYELYWPNGEKLPVNKGELPFLQENDRLQQTTFFIGGFPVGQEGKVKIVTWLDSSEGKHVTPKMESHVYVEHLTGKTDPPGAAPQYSGVVTRQ